MTDYYKLMDEIEKEFEPVFKEIDEIGKKYHYLTEVIKKRAINWARVKAEDYFGLPEDLFKKTYRRLLEMSLKHGIVWLDRWLIAFTDSGLNPNFLKEVEERLKQKFNLIL